MRMLTPVSKRRRKIIATAVLCLAAFLIGSACQGASSPVGRRAFHSHLNAIISLCLDSGSKIQSVGLPSDAIYQDTSQNLAQQAVRLAFQAAQAAAVLVNASDQTNAPASPAASSGSTQQQNLAQTLATLKSRIDQDQSKLDALNKQIASRPPSQRKKRLNPRRNRARPGHAGRGAEIGDVRRKQRGIRRRRLFGQHQRSRAFRS